MRQLTLVLALVLAAGCQLSSLRKSASGSPAAFAANPRIASGPTEVVELVNHRLRVIRLSDFLMTDLDPTVVTNCTTITPSRHMDLLYDKPSQRWFFVGAITTNDLTDATQAASRRGAWCIAVSNSPTFPLTNAGWKAYTVILQSTFTQKGTCEIGESCDYALWTYPDDPSIGIDGNHVVLGGMPENAGFNASDRLNKFVTSESALVAIRKSDLVGWAPQLASTQLVTGASTAYADRGERLYYYPMRSTGTGTSDSFYAFGVHDNAVTSGIRPEIDGVRVNSDRSMTRMTSWVGTEPLYAGTNYLCQGDSGEATCIVGPNSRIQDFAYSHGGSGGVAVAVGVDSNFTYVSKNQPRTMTYVWPGLANNLTTVPAPVIIPLDHRVADNIPIACAWPSVACETTAGASGSTDYCAIAHVCTEPGTTTWIGPALLLTGVRMNSSGHLDRYPATVVQTSVATSQDSDETGIFGGSTGVSPDMQHLNAGWFETVGPYIPTNINAEWGTEITTVTGTGSAPNASWINVQ